VSVNELDKSVDGGVDVPESWDADGGEGGVGGTGCVQTPESVQQHLKEGLGPLLEHRLSHFVQVEWSRGGDAARHEQRAVEGLGVHFARFHHAAQLVQNGRYVLHDGSVLEVVVAAAVGVQGCEQRLGVRVKGRRRRQRQKLCGKFHAARLVLLLINASAQRKRRVQHFKHTAYHPLQWRQWWHWCFSVAVVARGSALPKKRLILLEQFSVILIKLGRTLNIFIKKSVE